MPGRPEPGWDEVIERAARSRVTVVIGPSDAGKTWLVARLASALAARGLSVGVVDADLGQSEIGPPTTIGLGRVRGPLGRLADAERLALEFVGATSPVRHIARTARATKALVDRAFVEGLERVVVDTCGLVEQDLGRALKRALLAALAPDLVIALQRHDEAEAIVAEHERRHPVEVLRLTASPAAARRSADTRRRHREASLRAYFAGAGTVVLDLDRVTVASVDRHPPALAPDVLVGLQDGAGRTLGIGRILAVDDPARTITVRTPVRGDAVRTVLAGRETFRE